MARSRSRHIHSCSHWMYICMYKYTLTYMRLHSAAWKFTVSWHQPLIWSAIHLSNWQPSRSIPLSISPQAIKLQSRTSWATIATRVPTHSMGCCFLHFSAFAAHSGVRIRQDAKRQPSSILLSCTRPTMSHFRPNRAENTSTIIITICLQALP